MGVVLVAAAPPDDDGTYLLKEVSLSTNMHEDDVLGYNFALQVAGERGAVALLAKLRGNGPPPYTGSNMAFQNMDYLNVLTLPQSQSATYGQ